MSAQEVTSDNVKVDYPGGETDLAVVKAVEGNDGIALGKFLATTGYTTYDVGFVNTASTKSAITYIDGDKGILRYRGYPIDQLAEKSSFLEVAYLLIHGSLPSATQLNDFIGLISDNVTLPQGFERLFDGFPQDAHPMAVISSAVNALSAYYPDTLSISDSDQVQKAYINLLGQLPTIAAYAYSKSVGKSFLTPDSSRGLVADFLHLTFGSDDKDFVVDPDIANALDMLFILHADHEQNCSTSTVRLVGSSNANIYTSISGGINALWGPLHGGANQAVIEMLLSIQKSGGDVKGFMNKVKNKSDGVKLMGFGHRVYKNYDPRAAIVKKTADKVLKKLGVEDNLLELAQGLEEIALNDDYFISRKLYPNVDFYTGLIYRAMGFPERLFTVLFAIGRLPGWIAHWIELHNDPETKIGRPRQIYIGETIRDYVDINHRS